MSFLCEDIPLSITLPPRADEAALNVAPAFADELANQGFTAITKPASAHIHLFILRDCCHQSARHKSPASSIGNLLMHAPDQFLPRTDASSSLPHGTHTCEPALILKNKHINTLVQTRSPFRDQPFDGESQRSVVLLADVGKRGLKRPCCTIII